MPTLDQALGALEAYEGGPYDGGPADAVECLAPVIGRIQDAAVEILATDEARSVAAGPIRVGDFRCMWSCSEANARTHIWSYDGQHRRLWRRQRTPLQDVFDEVSPTPQSVVPRLLGRSGMLLDDVRLFRVD